LIIKNEIEKEKQCILAKE